MARTSLKNVLRLLNEEQEALTPDQCFLQDLKRSIELNDKKNARKPSQSYKPSSMNCIRNMYYQKMGKDPDESETSYNFIGICNSGTDTHVRIQTAVANMKEVGMQCDYVDVAKYVKTHKLNDIEIVSQQGMETKLKNNRYDLSFMCDGIIRYKRKYYILELKTETTNKYFRRTGVDPGHYNQGTAYSISLGIDEVIFVYINRDTLDMKSYMFVPTDDQKQELIGKITNCDGYVKRKIAPPRPNDLDSKSCQYCNYKSYCRRDG